jgi:4-amino-4-deoxy-L-arabinose transferase-like glycosyltransferase
MNSTASPEPQKSASPRPSNAKLSLLFTALTLLFCLGNSSLPLIDRDEPRFAEASREMLQSGDWIVPRFNDAPRYDKPPLIYWMHAGCYKILGVNEFASRLPAALCTAATAVVVLLWGTRMAGPATGLQAALMFALCVQCFVHGRAAVADPPMVFFSVVAAWAGWEWLAQRRQAGLALAFWVSLALGFLAKGPIAWIPIGMLGWAVWKKRGSGESKPAPAFWLGGFILMLALVCLWGIPALIQTRGDFAAVGLGNHVVKRSLVSMEGHGAKNLLGYLATLPFYFITVFPSFAPWAFWLPATVRFHWRRPTPESAYLLSGAVLTFAIFTLSRTKLPHYTLPAFPYLALLVALWWKENRSARLWRKTALTTAIVFLFVPLFAFPLAHSLSATESLMSELTPRLSPDTAVALVDYQEPSLIWSLRKKITGFPKIINAEGVAEWMAGPGKRTCILTADLAKQLGMQSPRVEATGWNFAKGKRLTLVALEAPQAGPGPANP